MHRHQFTGPNAALERAIEDDDPGAVDAALRAGASAGARGTYNITPVEYAVGTQKKQATAALFRHKADPNLKDDEGDNAVTLAVKLYRTDPDLLRMVLDAGGDPNTRRPDNDPVIVHFLADRNFDAITMLHARGADLDAVGRDRRSLIVRTAGAADWDVVWHMIELGADTELPKTQAGLVFNFIEPVFPSPGSPLYLDKVKVYRFLVAKGLHPTPPVGLAP